jgi:hypothetical protein
MGTTRSQGSLTDTASGTATTGDQRPESASHTPGPWVTDLAHGDLFVLAGNGRFVAECHSEVASRKDIDRANARLIAAAPDMLEALRLHKAWRDSEHAGPDYGGQTRDTPEGEKIWRAWWNNQLDLCARAEDATDAAISKATGA